MPRCFLALPVDFTDGINNLYKIAVNTLKTEKIKFVEPCNLHITIHFFGEISDDEVQTLIKNLENIHIKPINTYTEGFFVFGMPAKPTVVGIKLYYSTDFELMINKYHLVIKSLNYELDKRPYIPHLTFGRVKSSVNINNYNKLLSIKTENNPVYLKEVVLYKSILKPEGPTYEKLWNKVL